MFCIQNRMAALPIHLLRYTYSSTPAPLHLLLNTCSYTPTPLHLILYTYSSTPASLHLLLYTYSSTPTPLQLLLYNCSSTPASNTQTPLNLLLYTCSSTPSPQHLLLYTYSSLCAPAQGRTFPSPGSFMGHLASSHASAEGGSYTCRCCSCSCSRSRSRSRSPGMVTTVSAAPVQQWASPRPTTRPTPSGTMWPGDLDCCCWPGHCRGQIVVASYKALK